MRVGREEGTRAEPTRPGFDAIVKTRTRAFTLTNVRFQRTHAAQTERESKASKESDAKIHAAVREAKEKVTVAEREHEEERRRLLLRALHTSVVGMERQLLWRSWSRWMTWAHDCRDLQKDIVWIAHLHDEDELLMLEF